ncbi:MAG: hypothetical protein KatS3mg068_2674 [Candidatus Sericytochromatia bacterium]|nr:MAG: hypothetical protein KatS3mg068_2674 [Candidatus Sericytochromatia bacterium]
MLNLIEDFDYGDEEAYKEIRDFISDFPIVADGMYNNAHYYIRQESDNVYYYKIADGESWHYEYGYVYKIEVY